MLYLKRNCYRSTSSPVVVAGDTTAYNASAYRVNEGAALEELVKKLPGAEINEDGKLTINGEEIKIIGRNSDIKKSEHSIKKDNQRETFDYTFGAANLNLPWDIKISSNIDCRLKRG